MTLERTDPFMVDLLGPPLTGELADRICDSVLETLQIHLTREDVQYLHKTAERLAFPITKGQPVDGLSFASLKDLLGALQRLRNGIAAVRIQANRGVLPGRENIAAIFMWSDSDDEMIPDNEKLARTVLNYAEVLERRAKSLMKGANRISHGKGRAIVGYGEFVRACRAVWEKHRADKGWSEKEGRGSGPFVTFVDLIQELLPTRMRRISRSAVGDAVVAELKATRTR